MLLSPGERSILAYFPTSSSAQKVADILKEEGIDEVQVDRISRYGATTDAQINNPINRAVTGTGPTLFSDSTGGARDVNERILLGADPSVSGYGSNDYGIAGGKSFLVTIITTEEKVDKVVSLIKENGGYV